MRNPDDKGKVPLDGITGATLGVILGGAIVGASGFGIGVGRYKDKFDP